MVLQLFEQDGKFLIKCGLDGNFLKILKNRTFDSRDDALKFINRFDKTQKRRKPHSKAHLAMLKQRKERRERNIYRKKQRLRIDKQ